MDYTTLPSDEIIHKTIEALKANGIDAQVMETGAQAKEKVLSLIPQNSEVMDMTSVTLDAIGISEEIKESGNYKAVKKIMMAMDRNTQKRQMQRMGAAPDFAIGSVHAVTQNGEVVIASNTGSQLSAFAYAADKVIWVVGTQKIVSDLDQAMKRIYDYVLPLESERVKKAYGMDKSNVSKLLIINKEIAPNRITLIFVKEKLGF